MVQISHIYSSAEDKSCSKLSAATLLTDIVVSLTNGGKYIAVFVNSDQLEMLWQQQRQSGAYLSGTFFWMKNMVLVRDCKMKTVREVVEYLLDEGIFWEAFEKL